MKIYKLIIFSLVFLFLSLQTSGAMGQFFFFKHPLEGELAPDFALKNLGGVTLRMSEYRAGRPAVIFFWATWCPHCRTQLQELDRRSETLLKEGIQIILVDLQEDGRQVKAYLLRRGISLDVLLDEDAGVAEQYQVVGIPAFFFVSESGKVTAVKNLFPEDYKQFFQPGTSGISAAQSAKELAGHNE